MRHRASAAQALQPVPPETPWNAPPDQLVLDPDVVHVWWMPLELPTTHVQRLRHWLSPDERARVARFHYRKHHDHYIAAHGILRSILGRYLNVLPHDLGFASGPHGKPRLNGDAGIEFNLSHSEGLGLCAVARARRLGIDLEHFPFSFFDEKIAERFFSAKEVVALRALPAEQRHHAFLNCWTRKEAFVKALGEGLSIPLDRFDVSLAPDEPAALLRTRDDPDEVQRWSLSALPVGAEYVATLAVEGRGCQLSFWRWQA